MLYIPYSFDRANFFMDNLNILSMITFFSAAGFQNVRNLIGLEPHSSLLIDHKSRDSCDSQGIFQRPVGIYLFLKGSRIQGPILLLYLEGLGISPGQLVRQFCQYSYPQQNRHERRLCEIRSPFSLRFCPLC